jgi:hypothetical protein
MFPRQASIYDTIYMPFGILAVFGQFYLIVKV